MHDSFHRSKKYMILRGDNFQIQNSSTIARLETWYLSIKQPYVGMIVKAINVNEGKQYNKQAALILVAYAYI